MAKLKDNKGKALTRKQLARREKEQRIEQILTWVAIGVGILIVLILGYGGISEYVIKARRPVAQVGSVKISTGDFQAHQRYERLMVYQNIQQYEYYLEQFDSSDETMADFVAQLQSSITMLENQLAANYASTFAGQVLDSMIEETLVRQESAARNLVVSDEEIELEIESMMGYDREAAATVTDTTTILTEEQYKERYASFKENILKESKLSEAGYREMVATGVMQTKLQEALGVDVDVNADQVESIYLIVGTEEEALSIQTRINEDGEDATVILDEFNNDEDAQTSGYDLSWLPQGYISSQLGEEIERVTFNTPVGQASEPVVSSDGQYYVIYVTGHEERPLDESMLTQAKQERYNTWLAEQEEKLVERKNWESAVLTEP